MMEESQIIHIRENLIELLELIIPSASLLSHLLVEDILSRQDIENIKVHKTDIVKTKALLDIVVKRGAYEALLKALEQTNQSGAADILYQLQKNRVKSDSTNLQEKDKRDEGQQKRHDPLSDQNQLTNACLPFLPETFTSNLLKRPAKVLILSTLSTELSFLKILIYLRHKKTFMKSEKIGLWRVSLAFINRALNQVLQMKYRSSFVLLAVDPVIEINHKSLALLSQYLNQVAHPDDGLYTKIVVVTRASIKDVKENVISKLNVGIVEEVEAFEDQFEWNDLVSSYKEIVLSRNVYDQSKRLSVNDFCSTYVYADQEQFYGTVLRGKLLLDLILYTHPPVLFRQTIPVHRGKYIERRLRPRFCIKKSVFENCSNKDVVAVDGFQNLEDLKIFAGKNKGNFDTADNQLRSEISANFILLCNKNEFDRLCQRNRNDKNIHWLHHKSSKLFWKETRGSIQYLHSHIDFHEQREILDENVLYSGKNIIHGPVILCDTAGMGKSVLLANVAFQTQKTTGSAHLVLYIVLTDFITAINERRDPVQTSNETTSLEEAITAELKSQASEYSEQIQVIGQELGSHTRLSFFFDGLDEVAVDLHDKTFECLKIIKTRFMNAKLHVTTRPHLLKRLEDCLDTLGVNIEPFNRKDQIKFLIKFWGHENKVKGREVNEDLLCNFSKNCLNFINKKLSKVEKHIAGVPLQCLLIGETFDEEGRKYANQNPATGTQARLPHIEINSLADLYHKIVAKKYQKQLKPDNESLNLLHFYLATETIFADWAKKLRPMLLTKNFHDKLLIMFPKLSISLIEFQSGKLPKSELARIGILEDLGNDTCQFVHRTFAEFFIAKYVTESITQKHSCVMFPFLDQAVLETCSLDKVFCKYYNISKTIFCFKHSVICLFINILLPSLNANNYHKFARNSANREKIVTASALENLTNIYQIYKFRSIKECDFELQQKVLFCSILASTEQIFDDISPNSEKWLEEMLAIIGEHGNFKMMAHIYSRLGAKEILNSWNISQKQCIINACVTNTLKSDTSAVNNKRKILRLFTEDDTTPFFQQNNERGPPLFQHGVHIQLLMYMLARVDHNDLLITRDKANKSILHKLAEYLSSTCYESILRYFEKRHPSLLTALAVCKDKFGQTPIHTVIRHMEPSEYLVETLLKAKGQKNKTDETNYNVIWLALKYNRSAKCFKAIWEQSQLHEGEHKDKFGRSVFHIAAKYVTDTEILQFLLNDKHDVNQTDNFGNTPVFYALSNPQPLKIMPFLFNCVNFLHRNHEGQNILHLIAEMGSTKILELYRSLEGFSQSAGLADNHGNTPLHYALRCPTGNKLRMVETLMDFLSTSVRTKNKKGKCPLLYALTQKHVGVSFAVVEHFVSKVKPESNELINALDENFNAAIKNVSFR